MGATSRLAPMLVARQYHASGMGFRYIRQARIMLCAALLAACNLADSLPDDLQTPVTIEAAQRFAASCPISTPEQAARAVLRLARANGPLQRISAQRVTAIQHTTYAAGQTAIYADGSVAQPTEPPDAPIWLVEMEGLWVIAPPGSRASYTPKQYRVLVAVKAAEPCGIIMGFRAREVVVYSVD